MYDLTTGRLETLAGGTPNGDPGFIAQPRLVDFPTTDSATAHAVFYPPMNATVQPGSGPLPPLIIRPHAGPTSAAPVRLDLEVQFFTSRGLAVADVDYRGSTGYGRSYRRQLNRRWGRLDVSDCVDAARHLISLGEVDPRNVMIAGASAGGYTALMAAASTTTFAAATARSAIVDPLGWQQSTTTLQRHHADALVGADGDSTTYIASALRVPLLLIHGADDSVVSPHNILQLEQELRRRHHPCTLLVLAGEGHTIRGRGHIEQALEAELNHYLAVLAATDINQDLSD
jgi:dipeptidyl aminopeptidase/acylaminoacyl peptidase